MMNQSDVTEWLAANPKMMGAVWMTMLLLIEGGNVVAAGTGKVGP